MVLLMLPITTFVGLVVGPIVGFGAGHIPSSEGGFGNAKQNRLLAAVLGWTLAGVAGLIIGAFVCCNHSTGGLVAFNLAGQPVNGIVWTGWVAGTAGMCISIVTANMLEPKK